MNWDEQRLIVSTVLINFDEENEILKKVLKHMYTLFGPMQSQFILCSTEGTDVQIGVNFLPVETYTVSPK